MPPLPLVSVIIVNFNGWTRLRPCLEALERTREVAFETIVVDNGSTDESAAGLRANFPDVQLIQLESNKGFGAANEVAVDAAVGEYIALLNNDTEVEPDWLRELLACLGSDPRIAAVCSRLVLLQEPGFLNANGGGMSRLGFGYDRDFGLKFEPAARDEPPRDVLFPTAAAMLMRKEDFLACGGFDPAMFMYHEDVDLGWRLWLFGRRVVLCPQSVVRHYRSATTALTHSERWKAEVGLRHSVRATLKNYQWRTAFRVLRRLFRHYRRHGHLELIAKVARWNLQHLGSTLRARRVVQARRQISDAELFRRGLIDPADFAPPAVLPVSRPNELFELPRLHVGEHSAESRLLYGWHEGERVGSSKARWTTGNAACVLQVRPGARGTLKIQLHGPARPVADRVIQIECNGATLEQVMDERLQEVTLQTRADQAGRLHIVFSSAAWRPATLLGTPDLRLLGCMVREVEFVPDTPVARAIPQRASVIVPTFNRRAILLENLALLARQTWRETEIIVVDDGSTDGTWEAINAWRESHPQVALTLLRQENARAARARNHGLRHATGDIVIFIGDDMLVAPDLVEQHIRKHIAVGEPCAVLGYASWDVRMPQTPFLRFVTEAGYQFGYRHLKPGEEAPFTTFYTSNVSAPRHLLGENPFDAAFDRMHFEDTELGYRLHRRGLPLIYHPEAAVRHYHPQSLGDYIRRQVAVGAMSHVIFRLHPELKTHPLMTSDEGAPNIPWRWLASESILPIWEKLDAAGIPLPEKLYHAVMDVAFLRGRG